MSASEDLAVTLLLGLMACGEPTVTGPAAMVGQVRDAEGHPVAGLPVASLETDATTDAEGRFAVVYKDPDRYVHFERGDATYWRRFKPADEGRVVELALPAVRDVSLVCGVDCGATLRWTLDGAFEAQVVRSCAVGQTVRLSQIPVGTPAVACRDTSEVPELVDRGVTLDLVGPARVLRIELRGTEGALPDGCEVWVDGTPARSAGPGFWSAELRRSATVSASCGGRPARPRLVAADAGSVSVDWSSVGPTLDLEQVAPWADRVVFASVSGEDAGWEVTLRPSAEGTVALPPLGPGDYRVRVESAASSAVPSDGDPGLGAPAGPGLLTLRQVQGVDAFTGALRLEADRTDGQLPVVIVR